MGNKPSERPTLEVADIVRRYAADHAMAHLRSPSQEAVLRHIVQCRTAALGGHVDECVDCRHQRISYNSCRDRHCPKCQGLARADWLESRLDRLLPIPYFHVVFTIPEELHSLALGNRKVVFDILFASAAKTLKRISLDPKHLGAQIGWTAILHTWGQNLLFHPHLHCVVTGGGLSLGDGGWVQKSERFFLPVRVLGKLFRGIFLDALARARADGLLQFGGGNAFLEDRDRWTALRDRLYRKDWVVYAKRPFAGPRRVFQYLGRYTHRVAISNRRILAIDDGSVTFALKRYDHGERRTTMTVAATEFIRRFLLHVLPQGFTRIRHYGILAGRNVNTKLNAARRALLPDEQPAPQPLDRPATTSWVDRVREHFGVDVMQCPCCGGRLERTQTLARSSLASIATVDTT